MSNVKDLVELICRALVDYPDGITLSEREHLETIRIEVTSKPVDFGKLIGRQGRTAASVRLLAQVEAEREGIRATVDFLDTVK